MFFYLSKILKFLATPFIWIVVPLLLFVFAADPKRKKRYLWIFLFLFFFFSNPFLADRVVRWWEVAPYPASTITEPYDVGVLLGGSLLGYDQTAGRPVYSQSVDRLLQTIALYKSGKIKKILLSGGSGSITNPDDREADIIAEVLTRSGIPSTDIILERDSRNTYENVVFTKAILEKTLPGSRVLLITSAFHMRRSAACFEKAGMKADVYPVDPKAHLQRYTPDALIIPNAYSILLWDMLVHEWLGITMYKVAGYI